MTPQQAEALQKSMDAVRAAVERNTWLTPTLLVTLFVLALGFQFWVLRRFDRVEGAIRDVGKTLRDFMADTLSALGSVSQKLLLPNNSQQGEKECQVRE